MPGQPREAAQGHHHYIPKPTPVGPQNIHDDPPPELIPGGIRHFITRKITKKRAKRKKMMRMETGKGTETKTPTT